MSQRTHTQIIDAIGGAQHVSRVLGLPYQTVQSWRRRDRIPADYYGPLNGAFGVDLAELTAARVSPAVQAP